MSSKECPHYKDTGTLAVRLSDIHESQAYPARHKCAVCAYKAGYEAAIRDAMVVNRTGAKTLAKLLRADTAAQLLDDMFFKNG